MPFDGEIQTAKEHAGESGDVFDAYKLIRELKISRDDPAFDSVYRYMCWRMGELAEKIYKRISENIPHPRVTDNYLNTNVQFIKNSF